MKFYNRKEELSTIDKVINSNNSEFSYFLWRRRIGKTSLINYYFKSNNKDFLYFFVWNKEEGNLLKSFEDTLFNFLWFTVKFESLRDFLKFLFEYSIKNPNLNVVFDEFQNFKFVNKEIFSDFQEFWDIYKRDSNIKIFSIGSIYTLMEDIFQDKNAPLFWRATSKIFLLEFEVSVLIEILKDYNIYSNENLLDVYTIFWWIPKYLEVLDDLNDLNEGLIISILKHNYICDNSLFLREGQDLLLSEFWKSANVYFSILEAIANWKTKRSEIADYTKMNYDSLWVYLEKLEKVYKYIEKNIPIVKPKNILNRYKIKDNFLFFWFRYIYKKSNLIEIGKYNELVEFILNDFSNIKWFTFEKLVKSLIIKRNIKNNFLISFEKIWNYWDKKWNEIDLVCFNEQTKKVVFIECKLQSKKITNLVKEKLIEKSETIQFFSWYTKYYLYYSLDNLDEIL